MRLILMSDPIELRAKAGRCRELAKGAGEGTRATLLMLADDFEALANEADQPSPDERDGE
jgi:hypothetical protein